MNDAVVDGVVDVDVDVDADVDVDVGVDVVGLTASEASDKAETLSSCGGKPAYKGHCSPLCMEAKISLRAASSSSEDESKGFVHEDCSSNLVQRA